MKTLVLITSHFPFAKSETFLEAEISFLERNFNKTIIISQNVKNPQTREVDKNTTIYRYNTSTTFTGFIYLPALVIRNIFVIIGLIRDEIQFRKAPGATGTVRFLYLLKKIIKALQLKEFIAKVLIKENIQRDIVLYSYWLKTGAHAISLLNYPASIKVARAHGSDLYEEKTEKKYLPLLNHTCNNLNAVFFVSENGRKYLTSKLGHHVNFKISYLGTGNHFIIKPHERKEGFVIVSCSNLIPLKRVELIIKALANIMPGKKIKWMHFGDGILKSKLERLAEDLLSKNNAIEYKFMGHYPNKKLLELYNLNSIDLFINVSSTEGLPVSIMEAQSAGIPVIATNVGGVSEIVVEGTGSLIDPDFEPEQLTNLISWYSKLPEPEYLAMRENARRNWELFFNAPTNYQKFIDNINAIFVQQNQWQFKQ